jgi:uncharacterized protein (TIGR02328 family)
MKKLWHEEILEYLPSEELLQLHKDVCFLRGEGWKSKLKKINYIYKYPFSYLVRYHIAVMTVIYNRKIELDFAPWLDVLHRGYNYPELPENELEIKSEPYPEHDEKYLEQCWAELESLYMEE